MSAKKILFYWIIILYLFPLMAMAATQQTTHPTADQLGWVLTPGTYCGGYYLEEPFIYPPGDESDSLIKTRGSQGIFSLHGTSTLESVTINRAGQQITTNKAYLYRDNTGNITNIDMIGNIHLREPTTLIVAKVGQYNFRTRAKSLTDILYRTQLNDKLTQAKNKQKTEKERKPTSLTAWGKAYQFSQVLG